MRLSLTIATLFVAGLMANHLPGATIVGPRPYLSQADTPAGVFAPGTMTHLENFESPTGPWEVGFKFDNGRRIGPKFVSGGGVPVTDSVDADDSAIDGDGTMGSSWFHSGRSLTLKFDMPVPSAGIVWTDGDNLTTSVKFEVLGADNTTVIATYDGPSFFDSVYSGTTQEDRFFGAVAGAGESIGGFRMTLVGLGSGIEVDHVQYAWVPEPSMMGLSALGSLAISFLRRRRKLA